MGMLSRTKGKSYERLIASKLREKLPEYEIRRSSQAERAYQSDVFLSGPDPLARTLWLELTDSKAPDPEFKLEQAERDVGKRKEERWPIVIWHKIRDHRHWVTMRIETLFKLYAEVETLPIAGAVVTLDLDDFIDLLVIKLTGTVPVVSAGDAGITISEDLEPPG